MSPLFVSDVGKDERISYVKQMMSRLPDHNYAVMKYMIEFLSLVRLAITPKKYIALFSFYI